jgi:16S rRNA (guanine527-N7)-methyltransferase
MPDGLVAVLLRARELGFLGPGDPHAHRRHALGFADAYEALTGGPPAACCDLGAGGGVPGLVLAERWPHTPIVLVEASARRCGFLRGAIDTLGIGAWVRVSEGRVEELARTDELEGRFELVTARSFAPPATTAECAARLLAPSGVLLVAEPPVGGVTARWPEAGLATLGLGPAVEVGVDPHLVAVRREGSCPDRYPRRTGVPGKRPLF